MSKKWTRPDSVPYPSVWSRYVGRNPFANGKVPKFRIQDAPEEMLDEMIQHMLVHYIRDEPLAEHLGIQNDEDAKRELRTTWATVFKERCVLLALLDNPEDFPEDNLPKIAGVNWTAPADREWKVPAKNNKIQIWLGILDELSHKVDVYEKYNVDIQMCTLGLSVDPAYRMQGLGEAIVQARFPLGRAVGLPLTSTVFSSVGAQAIGRKCGMDLLSSINPEDYMYEGVPVYKGINVKSIEYVAARIVQGKK